MKTSLFGALARYLCVAALGASTSLQAQVDKTPVLHLSFDQVSGTTVGSIVTNTGSGGLGMNGTLNAGVNGTVAIVGGGKFGNALSVSGAASSDTSVRIANSVVPLNATDNWTVAMWVQTTTPGGAYAYQGDGGWGGGNTLFYMNLAGTGSGTQAGGVRNGQNWVTGTNTTVNDGQWHHLVVTCNGATRNVYVDGVLDTPNGDGDWGGNGTGGQFWIGGGGTGQNDGQVNLNGLVDEVYVFNQALSLSDIQSLTNNIVPKVPVTVTANPASGYRGQTFTLTATVTPGAGTVTNITANLSALNLTNAASMVLSSGNVFTNSFTAPTNAPVGARNLTVTARTTTDPFVGSGGATFTVVARPPTNAILVTQLAPVSAYEYTEASFLFATTNDAPNDAPFPMAYSWYTNNVLVSSNMGSRFTFLTTPADNGMQVRAIARVADPLFSSLTVTSVTVSLTVNPGTVSYTNGLKQEFFGGGATRLGVEIGNVGPGVVHMVTEADSPGGFGDNATRRYSGWFIPPANDDYVFFVAADDDTDVFLSTDSSPANKRLIAQETVWSGTRNWLTPGPGTPGPYEASQKRSDQWSPDPVNGVPAPYAAGIPLVAGQKYYFESVVHNGTGGDNWAVTYQTVAEGAPLDGSASRMTAASNNIVLVTWPGTTLTWAQDLTGTNVFVLEGNNTNFTAVATSDAEMTPVYQWYIAGAPFPGATGTNFALSNIPLIYNNAQVYVVARIEEGSLVITSRVGILHVTQAVREAGFIKDERFDGRIVNDIITGNLPATPSFQMAITEWGISVDNAGGHDNFARRVTGWFKPPTTGLYTFYVTSDDDSILFLSTDETPGNKRQIASQGGWNSGGYRWGTANGGGVASQTVSDTFTINAVAQNPGGIMLTQGQRYYIEQDMHQGGGGANLGVTYTMFGDAAPAQSSQTALLGSVIEMTVERCSFVAFTQQPQNVANAMIGSKVGFTAAGTTDSQVSVGGPRGYEEDFANSKLFFQWFTNGVAVPGANSRLFLLGPVTADMVGMPVMCQTRALGYTDNALNPIWTNSTSATITSVVAPTYGLRGHWISGAASLADSANVAGPGVYDGIPIRATTATRYYHFTNDLPPGATPGAQSLYLNQQGILITNTATSDPGYMVDTFDGGIQSGATVMFWAKGWPGAWNPWVSKAGDNGTGWQLRTFNAGPNATFTIRGTGGVDDPQSSVGSNDGKWHHYAGTWDGTNFIRNLYVDGVLRNTDTGSTLYTLPSPSRLAIGARYNGLANGNFFTGHLYDVRIYNYPVAQSQILNINNLPPPPITSEVFGSQLTLTWQVGTLLQATNVLGPWTTNSTVSPVTIDMTLPQQFFRVKNP